MLYSGLYKDLLLLLRVYYVHILKLLDKYNIMYLRLLVYKIDYLSVSVQL